MAPGRWDPQGGLRLGAIERGKCKGSAVIRRKQECEPPIVPMDAEEMRLTGLQDLQDGCCLAAVLGWLPVSFIRR